jgi:DNA polymerase IV
MQKHDGNIAKNNPNARTIAILEQMLQHYERTSDQWRTIAYRKAISALKREKEKVVTKGQALQIPSIGERLASKIEEIVWTNRLRRLEYANLEPNDQTLQIFLNVYGVGFAQGLRSLDDLKMKAELTKNQRVGVEHYEDFLQRIPRAEVEAQGQIVRQTIQRVDPAVNAMVAGSYRRGALDSGDIDLLITKPGASLEEIRSLMMDIVVPDLFQQGFLQASLASSFRSDGSKWHGASTLPGSEVWRRIDLLFVPWDEIGAALIYFTGNDIFNRSLRLLARKKGICLNQHGLFEDVLRGPNRVKMSAGRLLESQNEKRIFELLGVPWRPPEHRVC